MQRSTSSYRVIYGDTDQMGVVYYANYLAFFERARCEFMREHGFDYAAFERGGYFLPVADAQVSYRRPARFDDLLTFCAEVTEVKKASLVFGYRILRGDELLATGSTTHACIDRSGRPVRLPDVLRLACGASPATTHSKER